MKKKSFVLLCTALLVLTYGGGFLLSAGNQEAPTPTVTLRLSRWDWTAATMGVYEKYIEQFESENPGIQVEFDHSMPYGQYKDGILRNFMSGQAPDIFVTYDEMFGPFVNMGALMVLNDFIGKTPNFREKFYDAQWALGTVQGKQYGIPFRNGPQILFYNKTMLKKAGLPETLVENGPQTLDEFLLAAKAVTDGKQFGFPAYWADFAGVQTFRTFLLASGGNLLNDDGSPAFNDGIGVKVLEFLMDIEHTHKIVPSGSVEKEKMLARNEFSESLVAMITDGPWLAGLFSNVDFGMTEVFSIAGGSPRGTGGGYVMHSISAQSRFPEESWKLMQVLSSAEFIDEYCLAGSLIPTRIDTVAGNPHWSSGYFPMLIESLARENSKSLPAHPKIGELMNLLRTGMQSAALRKDSAKNILDGIAATWNNIR